MLLHIGENVSISLDRLLFVLNDRGMTPWTRKYIDKAKKERRYMNCAGAPKAYLVVHAHGREFVYASMIASSTLEKRWREEISRCYLNDRALVTMDIDAFV
ncbi:MAG: hypothetical protein RRZ24_03740 [Clostridia bacterium]